MSGKKNWKFWKKEFLTIVKTENGKMLTGNEGDQVGYK